MTLPEEPNGPIEPNEPGPERSPQLQAFEAQLAALVPRDDRLDRDRLMYLAGQESARAEFGTARPRRRRWALPASFGAAAGALAASLLMTALAPHVAPLAPTGHAPRVELAEALKNEEANQFDTGAWTLTNLIDAPAWVDAELTAAGLVRGTSARSAPIARDAAVVNAGPSASSRPLTSRSVDELLAAPAISERSS
jgi:hypothetical protein